LPEETLLINEKIRSRNVRLISDDGQTTLISFADAMLSARRQNLDLMMVAAGDPPVCRILDADRFRFERKKTEREQARRQRAMAIDTKEIQLRPMINNNDLLIKVKRAKAFLQDGDKVKLTVRFRGRERHHRDFGRRIIDRFITEVGDHRVDKPLADGDADLSVVLGSLVSKADLIKQRGRS
jgi:translation initiation factor IF-3